MQISAGVKLPCKFFVLSNQSFPRHAHATPSPVQSAPPLGLANQSHLVLSNQSLPRHVHATPSPCPIYLIFSYLILSNPTTPNKTLSYLILSDLILSYLILSDPTLSYLI